MLIYNLLAFIKLIKRRLLRLGPTSWHFYANLFNIFMASHRIHHMNINVYCNLVAASGNCGSGQTGTTGYLSLVSGSCVFVSPDKKIWAYARIDCQQRGGDLLKVGSLYCRSTYCRSTYCRSTYCRSTYCRSTYCRSTDLMLAEPKVGPHN